MPLEGASATPSLEVDRNWHLFALVLPLFALLPLGPSSIWEIQKRRKKAFCLAIPAGVYRSAQGPGPESPHGVLFECCWAPGSECPKECFLRAFWHFWGSRSAKKHSAQKHSKSTLWDTFWPGPLGTPVNGGRDRNFCPQISSDFCLSPLGVFLSPLFGEPVVATRFPVRCSLFPWLPALKSLFLQLSELSSSFSSFSRFPLLS